MISLYYYEDLNMKEIGEILGITESRVCQIHTKSVLRLRAKLKNLLDRCAGASEPTAALGRAERVAASFSTRTTTTVTLSSPPRRVGEVHELIADRLDVGIARRRRRRSPRRARGR